MYQSNLRFSIPPSHPLRHVMLFVAATSREFELQRQFCAKVLTECMLVPN